jgi:hypothetical protein
MKLEEVEHSVSQTYQAWTCLKNQRFCQLGRSLTWRASHGESSHQLADTLMSSTVLELIKNGDYSFQCDIDDGIFRLYYKFDARGRHLNAASVAFYRAYPPDFSIEAYLEDSEDQSVSSPIPDGPVGWIRFDYSNCRDTNHHILHHFCHLHLSGFPAARLSVDGVPTPAQFVEFIMASFYPNYYAERRFLRKNVPDSQNIRAINSPSICSGEFGDSSLVIHLRTPRNQI